MNLEYMKVSLFEISYKNNELFHDILIFWDAPVEYHERAVAKVRISLNNTLHFGLFLTKSYRIAPEHLEYTACSLPHGTILW